MDDVGDKPTAPPHPNGPHESVLDKHNRRCRPDAKGRLMPVDESGTIRRTRADPSPMARPSYLNRDFWDNRVLSRLLKLLELFMRSERIQPAVSNLPP